VKDSEVEARVKILFDVLANIDRRRSDYMRDIDMFKKQLDKTFAITSTELIKRKNLEEIIISRDRKFL